MSVALAACPACARHVRVNEPGCPFCREPLPSSFREITAPPPPTKRLGRAALFALRVGALSATTAACGGALGTKSSERDSGPGGVAYSIDATYGGPPVDARAGQDAEEAEAAEGPPAYNPVPVPVYGGPCLGMFTGPCAPVEPDASLDAAPAPVDAAGDGDATDAGRDATWSPCPIVAAYGGFPCLDLLIDASSE